MDKDNRISEWRQASKERAEMLDRRLQVFLQPVVSEVARGLDLRLLKTWILLVKVIFVHRHRNEGGWLSALGSYLLTPLQAEAGRKRVTRLIHSPDWDIRPIEAFLWQQANRRIAELEAQGSDVWLVWDESEIEKAESQKAEGLMPVRSSKAARLTHNTSLSGKPVFVNGVPWVQLIVTGMKGHLTMAQMRWWSKQGPQASNQRAVEQQLLAETHQRWGKRVVHTWDRGFAGLPWLGQAIQKEVRFVVRWPRRYRLDDALGIPHQPSDFTRRIRSWGHGELSDLRRRCKVKIGVVAVPVWLDQHPLWLVVARRGAGKEAWYFLTNEPAEGFEQAWRVVAGYTRRWQVEMSFRCNKSEFAFESPRLHKWEHRCKLLGLLTLAYAFLLSLLDVDAQELRHWLLDNWCHRTGRRLREVAAPLYRLRQAIQRLWLSFPPRGLGLLNTG
jgi:hypothetical protein